ncbi:MAG: tetraacyldisaccharide 4'-kinase [Saprospiraceae bacterium]|nr:tetraacyldisaccharide 4'-kinase [Saprospiraceae bacterium]
MIQQFLFKLLMVPFALLYGIGVILRNGLYEAGFLKSIHFSVPVISVGNLTVGGAGKSPHIEFLVRALKDYIHVSTLSRGYKRKSKGFASVEVNNRVDEVGDEPLQFKRKFPDIGVYVSENREIGIPKIMAIRPETQVVLLDDAFQHRSVKAGINILLTEYGDLFINDFLLPVGRLREWRSAYKRASTIVVTKCPPEISEEEKQAIRTSIQLQDGQRLFFSQFRYGKLYQMFYPSVTVPLHPSIHALVITGIARTKALVTHLEAQLASVKIIEYGDHHNFTRYEISQLKKQFDAVEEERKIIITTEKDAVRLEKHQTYLREQRMPIFILPVFVSFLGDDSLFTSHIQEYLLHFRK